MKKLLPGFHLIFLVALFSLLALAAAEPGAEKPVIKVGYVIPLTGEMSAFAEGFRSAVQLAHEQLPPSTRYQYQILFEDSKGSDPIAAVLAFKKLVTIDHIDVVVTVNDNVSHAVKPLAAAAAIPHIALDIDSTIAGGYSFTDWTPAATQTHKLLEMLALKKCHRLCLIGLNHAFPHSIATELEKQNTSGTIELSKFFFNPQERDFRSLIAKAKEAKPDIYLVLAFPPTLDLVIEQMHQANITEITSIEAFEYMAHPQLVEGRWYIAGNTPTPKFRDDFKSKYGEPPNMGAANAYDTFNLIACACETFQGAQKPSGTELLKQLHQIKNFAGAIGQLQVDAGGIIESEATVKVIKNGRAILEKE